MDALSGLLLITLAIGGYLAIFRRTDDALHPLAIFVLLWFGIFGFAHFNVPRTFDEPYYADPFGILTYSVVIGAGLLFILGFWLADPGLERVDRTAIAERFRTETAWPNLRWITVLLWAAATIMTVVQVSLVGEIPLFSPRIDELRQIFKLSLLGYVWDLHYAVALFGTMLAVHARTRAARMGWILLGLSSVIQLAFAGVRVSPMTALAWAGVYLFYRLPKVRVRHLLTAALVAISVFTVIEQFRRNMYDSNPALVNPRLDLSASATAWAHTAASFKNLQYTLERGDPPLHMGLTSYDLPKTINPAARYVDDEISYVFGTHNTPTFLSFLFYDFGWGGMLIVPAIYGAMVAFVYRMFRRRTNIFWLVVYIDFLLAVALAFRTHRFLGNSLIWFGGVALLVLVLSGRGGDPWSEADSVEDEPGEDDDRAPADLPINPGPDAFPRPLLR